MHFADQSGVLASIRLLQGRGESDHPRLLGILPDFKHWCLSLIGRLNVFFLCLWLGGFTYDFKLKYSDSCKSYTSLITY